MDTKDLYLSAFDYYKLYLKQRTDSFNFFLVLAGFLMSAMAVIFASYVGDNNQLLIIIIVLSTILSVVSFLFYKLDGRTKQFLRKTEEILISYENEITISAKKLFIETEVLRKNTDKKITMGKVFNSIYIIFLALTIVVSVLSVILIFI